MTSPPSSTVHFHVLGPVAVTRDASSSIASLLTQPRRQAVLAYLALARPRGLHSRDTLVALLWAESDQAGGRHALRNVLHAIRQALGSEVIATAGDAMVGLNFDEIFCDAIELERDLAAGRIDEAIARYHGELLQGFHVSEAPEFERWLDGERRRFSDMLLVAAWSLADAQRKAGDLEGARQTAHRAAAIAPDDELSLRRLIRFLDEAGDRFGAARAYDEFAARLRREYDAEPSTETQALLRALREAAPATERVSAAAIPRKETPRSLGAADAKPSARLEPTSPNLASSDMPDVPAESPVTRVASRYGAKWRWGISAAVLIAITAVAAVWRTKEKPPASAAPTKLVVLPMENATGDPRLDYVGAGLAEGIATRLEGIGGITVRSGARSDWPAATRHDFKEIGRQFGSVILLKTILGRIGDSLEVRASVLDLASSGEKIISSRRFTTSALRDMESDLAASVAGAVFRVPLPAIPRQSARPVDPESYRLMLAGWHQLLTIRNSKAAKDLFLAAVTIDPLNARAWSGLSSAWARTGGTVGENLDDVEAAAARALALDSLQGSALADIAFARAMRYRNLADGMEWMRKAIAAEPSNPEIFLVLSALYRHAWMWDRAVDAARIAEKLDPLTLYYVDREAVIGLCSDRPAWALPLYERELSMSSSDTSARRNLVRTLARLGRYDDAIAEWRKQSDIARDTTLSRVLSQARGKNGFLAAKELEGRRRLTALQRRAVGEKVSPLNIMQARFAAGDIDGGFSDLEALISQRSVALYRLPCMPDLDEIHGTARFAAILRRTGPLPQR